MRNLSAALPLCRSSSSASAAATQLRPAGCRVLQWMRPFLTDHTQQLTTRPLPFSVPQRSVLGPLLYTLYIHELRRMVARHDIRLHQFADDSQVLVLSTLRTAVHKTTACIEDINAYNEWMNSSRLRLNPTMTQFMRLASPINDVTRIKVSSLTRRQGRRTGRGDHRCGRCNIHLGAKSPSRGLIESTLISSGFVHASSGFIFMTRGAPRTEFHC